jgi:phosphorylase/glycogen(starch) synthase
MPYYEALAGCDLGIFPSYYEPWGYTPLESAAYSVPTVTTDLAGFGKWKMSRFPDKTGVHLISRYRKTHAESQNELTNLLKNMIQMGEEHFLKKARLSFRAAHSGESGQHRI